MQKGSKDTEGRCRKARNKNIDWVYTFSKGRIQNLWFSRVAVCWKQNVAPCAVRGQCHNGGVMVGLMCQFG